jgi:hypothetical protein
VPWGSSRDDRAAIFYWRAAFRIGVSRHNWEMALAMVKHVFNSRAEFWAFLALSCVVAFIVLLLLTSCQMPLR